MIIILKGVFIVNFNWFLPYFFTLNLLKNATQLVIGYHVTK